MGNFKEDVKVPSPEEKKDMIVSILWSMINSPNMQRIEQIQAKKSKISQALSEDECVAVYNLGIEIKKLIISSNRNERLFKFLNISEYCKNDGGNLLKFINACVQDIQEMRIHSPKLEWYLQVNKIFDRMEGRNPYRDELLKTKGSDEKTKSLQ